MKFYKYTDLFIQGILLIIALLVLLMYGVESRFFWLPYLLLICWQILGYLLHIGFRQSWVRESNRRFYGKMLVSIFFLGLFSLLLVFANIYAFWVYYITLLIVSPLFILFYFMINFLELKNIEFRELIHLK